MTTLVQEANRVEELEEHEGVMVVLDRSGDTKHIWDRRNADEVRVMRGLFDQMVEKGYQAWSVTGKGNKDRKISTFDPEAEKIIFSPALVGG